MGQLTNQFVSQSYQGLLNLENTNTGVTATLQYVTDGVGNKIPMQVSTSSIVITGSFRGDGSGLTGITANVDSGSLVTTSSFNAFTSSIDGRVDALELETGSLQLQINQKLNSSSFNTYTSSNDAIVNSLVNATGSYATTSSLTSLSQSIATTDLAQDNRLNSIESITGSFATTSSLTSLSQSIAVTDLTQDGRLTSLESATSSLQNQINQKLDTGSFNTYTGNTLNLINTKLDSSSFNSYTSSNDGKVNDLISKTGSYATTGSNNFVGQQNINGSVNVTGSLNVTGEITALSASITYLETIYQTSSVIFSSGSNILGDEAGDTQTLYGTVRLPNGPLSITGSVRSSGEIRTDNDLIVIGNIQTNNITNPGSAGDIAINSGLFKISLNGDTEVTGTLKVTGGITGSLQGTASYATQALSASYAPQDPLPAGVVSGSQQILDLGFATTSSVNTKLDTGSFNTYSGNTLNLINQKLDTGSFNSYTSSNDAKVDSLINATSSYVTETESGSFMITGSVSGPTSTFTKGDGSQFSLTVNNVQSASHAINADTASFYGGTVVSASYAINADTASIARDVIVVAKNNNPSTLTRGTVVRIVGADGNNPLIDSASFINETESANVFGMLSDDVATNAFANVVVLGKVIGLNTDNFPAGALLFLSSSGTYSTASVTPPSQSVRLGQVLRQNINQGSIYFNAENGYELGELHNVIDTANQTGELLSYVSGSYGLWVNKTSGQLGLATTGSNIFKGNQTITGSVTVSGSAISNTSGVNTQYLGSSFGGNVGVFNNSNNTEIGLALDGSDWTTNWSKGPILYVNNTAGDTYEGVFGFQNKANYTDGRITLLKNTDLSGSLIVTGGVTGSFRGDGSGLTGLTLPSGIVSSSQQITAFGFATTGSNVFKGNQTITGSVTVSGSAISNTSGVNTQYLGSSFGGNLGVFNNSNNTEIGLALDGASWTSNWSTGPIMYVNNTPGDTYEGVFGFQDKTNYTDGRITALKPMVFNAGITGSVNVTGSFNITGNNGFPLNVDGTISSKRFSFVGNPFNTTLGGTFGSLKFDGNNTRLEYVNNDLGTPATKSAVYLTTNTGSNFTAVENEAWYAGTIAKTALKNDNGVRTFTVSVDSSEITGSLTVSGGVTGSFYGDGSGLTGITASAPNNVATTGSNIFIGNQTITGSVNVSGSVIQNSNTNNGQYMGVSFGGNIGVYNVSNFTEVGLALDGASWTSNWSSGPILYVNNTPGDTYEGVFGFQNKTNYTDGRITALKPMVFNAGVTGSLSVTGTTTLNGNNGFPLNVNGTITSKRVIFSGNPFNSNIGGTFGGLQYDGNNTRLEYVNTDFGTPSTASYNYLTTDTGSNFTRVTNGATYSGTTAETILNNGSGVRTFSVNVDSTVITGSLTVSGSAIITGSVQGNVNNLTVSSNTASLNLNNANFFQLQLTGSQDIRIEPSNIKAGQTVNIKLNTTGSGTVSFPTSVKQVSGSAYVPSTGTTTDIITLVSFDSTNLFLANVKNLI